MANRTLDTQLQQVAIDFFNDEEFHWHGRLPLIQAGGSKWITATPDLDVEITELAYHRVVPLQRNSTVPPRIVGNYYNFDPLREGENDDLLTRAGQLARVLGIVTSAGTTGQRTWRVADPAHTRFDEEIPNTDMVLNENFVHRGNVGLNMIEPDQTEPV